MKNSIFRKSSYRQKKKNNKKKIKNYMELKFMEHFASKSIFIKSSFSFNSIF